MFKGKNLQRGYGSRDGSQDGQGLFGDLIKSSMPLAASFGKSLLKSGVGLASDFARGKSFKEAAISRGKVVAGNDFSSIRSALTGRVWLRKSLKNHLPTNVLVEEVDPLKRNAKLIETMYLLNT